MTYAQKIRQIEGTLGDTFDLMRGEAEEILKGEYVLLPGHINGIPNRKGKVKNIYFWHERVMVEVQVLRLDGKDEFLPDLHYFRASSVTPA